MFTDRITWEMVGALAGVGALGLGIWQSPGLLSAVELSTPAGDVLRDVVLIVLILAFAYAILAFQSRSPATRFFVYGFLLCAIVTWILITRESEQHSVKSIDPPTTNPAAGDLRPPPP